MVSSRTQGGNAFGGRQGAVAVRFALKGGPELSRKLGQLSKDMSGQKMAIAVLAGADVLADEWRRIVPYFEGHYRRSITAVSSVGRDGATGLVFPADVPGLPDDQQPRRYAARLEFGSQRATLKTLKAGRKDFARRGRKMQPSLRPAFDNAKSQMVDAIADQLRAILP